MRCVIKHHMEHLQEECPVFFRAEPVMLMYG